MTRKERLEQLEDQAIESRVITLLFTEESGYVIEARGSGPECVRWVSHSWDECLEKAKMARDYLLARTKTGFARDRETVS